MYGDGPTGNNIRGWFQGDRFQVKLINLDKHTHYFRNVDFGARLHNDIVGCCSSGSHSFEVMNFKPTYGAPKVAEMQWRAGWGFRPHFDVIHQQGVFPRIDDRQLTKTFLDGAGEPHEGWQYSGEARGGDFRFNPPPFIIGTVEEPSLDRLREGDGSEGLVIGQLTEGYGQAKMCSTDDFPLGQFCAQDISAFNPHGAKNIDTDSDGVPDVLWFPPFLRNPNSAGGDIIPPTTAWKPFLWINPNNGTLFIDPTDPEQGYWADLTYSHGRPIAAGSALTATIEAPRAAAQLFYQFDDLFHDNAIFSPHPSIALQISVQRERVWWTQPQIEPGITYDVVRGDLGLLQSTAGDFEQATVECLANDEPGNLVDFSGSPPPGEGFWFLVRMVTPAGNGTYDEASGSQVGSRDAGIDAAAGGCP
jgi:hypothetical protein